MSFVQVHIQAETAFSEIFMAELAEIGYDTFEELEDGLKAYIEHTKFDKKAVLQIIENYKPACDAQVDFKGIEKENWNEQWEKNYDPIEVEDQCRVRATFHDPDPRFPIEIIINPKMSFGTGHHATTWQMLKLQLDIEFKDKKVLDVGTGTGILAIMAGILGACYVEATDIDDWCVENSLENFNLNNFPEIHIQKGPINELSFNHTFDVVLANINKNVLIEELPAYSDLLVKGGYLMLSGFYESDEDDIRDRASEVGMRANQMIVRDQWAAMLFTKNT